MDLKKATSILKRMAVGYWVFVIVIYLVAGDQFHYSSISSDAFSPSATVGEIVAGKTVYQRLEVPVSRLQSISLMFGTYNRENTGTLVIRLEDENQNELTSKTLDVSQIRGDQYTVITLDEPLEGLRDQTVVLTVSSPDATEGNALTIYAGNMISSGRFDLEQEIPEEDLYMVNEARGMAKLCVKLNGIEPLSFYKTYWLIVGGIFAVFVLLCLYWLGMSRKGRPNPLLSVYMLLTRYEFLLRQLIMRDFKIKYKRSALGMAWSILNPLLTMAVQYVIFSTIFKSDIDNFPVYLLCGIVFFNFFNEAVSMGMMSITSNASLIKKVYIPKYVFPVSRILSSMVNLLLSMVPLLLVMIITRTAFRPSLILVVFAILCLLGFVMGMGLLLTTAMTFFQDVQFLWGIASMLWMYMTPIFYPETIIPPNLLPLFRMNPMYQYITFVRTCVLDGVSPEPMSYLWCMVSAGVVLLLGIAVFKRYQNEFVQYL